MELTDTQIMEKISVASSLGSCVVFPTSQDPGSLEISDASKLPLGAARTQDLDRVPLTDPVDIRFYNITSIVHLGFNKGRKTILHGVSGVFKSGQLTAIMGPSGAGKSSLLNALTGFSSHGVTGSVRMGNTVRELTGKTTKLTGSRKKCSYILQDDRLDPFFTVSELMKFAADMKLGNTVSEKTKLTVIKDVINKLGLSGTENTKSGNLSGGQKKRLSIAVELLDNPPVMYLDEPTTGLDCLTAMRCMKTLKNLAREGRTIVCTIHQPLANIYSMFDLVYLLADGSCIYNGPSENTVPYFASIGLQCPMHHSPADYILEIASDNYGKLNELLALNCSQSIEGSDSMQPPRVKNQKPSALCEETSKALRLVKSPHEFYKFFILLRRSLVQQFRDWTALRLKLFLHVAVSSLIGALCAGIGDDASLTLSNLGYMASMIVYLSYTSIMPAVLTFPLELSVVKKEHFNNWYNLKTYYFATLLSNMPLQIFYTIVFTIPSYLISEQPTEGFRFIMLVMALANVSLLFEALGNIVGTSLNPTNGLFIAAIITGSMILFMGFLVLFRDMSPLMMVVSNFSIMKHAYDAMVLAMYSYGRTSINCPSEKLYCHLRYPEQVLDELSIEPGNYRKDMIILVAELVILKILAYYNLKWYMTRSK